MATRNESSGVPVDLNNDSNHHSKPNQSKVRSKRSPRRQRTPCLWVLLGTVLVAIPITSRQSWTILNYTTEIMQSHSNPMEDRYLPPSTSQPISASSAASTTQSTSRQYSVIVCGCVRDAEPHLEQIYQSIQYALFRKPPNEDNDGNHTQSSLFHLQQFLFFENDSTDQTVSILRSWQNRTGSNVTILQPNNGISLVKQFQRRTRRITICRSRIWQHLQNDNDNDNNTPPDFVLWIDVDDVNSYLTGLETCLDLPSPWSGCCVNNVGYYYDLWALRAPGWLDCDWWWGCDKNESEVMAKRHISAAHEPIRVQSCFGGAVLYRYKGHLEHYHLDNLYYYQQRNPGNIVRRKTVGICEHVPFHQRIAKAMAEGRQRGGQQAGGNRADQTNTSFQSFPAQLDEFHLYIQPKFLNSGPRPIFADEKAVRQHWRSAMERDWDDPALAQYYAPPPGWNWSIRDWFPRNKPWWLEEESSEQST